MHVMIDTDLPLALSLSVFRECHALLVIVRMKDSSQRSENLVSLQVYVNGD